MEAEPRDEASVPHMVPCPACGVPVAIGYPRCPKCHAAVPQGPRARRGSVREQLLGGGTSVEPATAGTGGLPWLPWVLAALVLIAIGGFLAFRGGDSKPAPAASVEDTEEDDADVDDTDDTDDDEIAAAPRTAPGEEPEDTMPQAVQLLDDHLRGERLWAKVVRDDTVLAIESKLCAQIEGEIGAVAADLKGLGATAVSCTSVNGELMFERGL